jgi:alpha-beta hydrolase superfamily lysophospholipase
MTFTDADGWRIFVRAWTPAASKPKAIVQIVHGVAEHSGRYERLANCLTASGYAVYANDHRGHGQTAGERKKFGIAGPDGWNAMVGNLYQLSKIARQSHPGLPLFLFAHSLGSLMAQQYLQNWGNELAGAVFSGTLSALAKHDERLTMLETATAGDAAQKPSAVFAAIQSGFNKQFEPGDTWLDWLTRDTDEVRQYAADPLCRVAICNELAADILRQAKTIWLPAQEAKIPRALPLLVVSGERDPVGDNTANVRQLLDRYRHQGMTNVECQFYPDARHDLLHELNREQVQRDIVSWLERRGGG